MVALLMINATSVARNCHQNILFSQESEVDEWAAANLGPRDKAQSLGPPGIAK